MNAADLTYGQLMDQALLDVARVLAAPVRLGGHHDAVAAVQARVRIYRTTARTIQACTAWLGPATHDPAAGLSAADQRDLDYLHADLTHSTAVTAHLLRVPTPTPLPRSLPGRLLRAADTAGMAWDLLSAELTPAGHPRHPADGWTHRLGARAVLADALLLVRGMTDLDITLERALWTVITRAATPPDIATGLRQVAEDCHTTFLLGVQATARACLHRIPDPVPPDIRRRIDAVTPTVRGTVTTPLAPPARAVEAVERYLTWLHRRTHDLTAPDLTSVAAIGSRLTHLIATHTPTTNPAAGADAIRAWRQLHHTLSPLHTIHPRPTGYYQPHRLATWIDHHLRTHDTHPDWPQAATTLATRLPELADLGQTALHHLHTTGRLYAPTTHGPYRYLHAPTPTITTAHTAFTTAHHTSTTLIPRPTHVPLDRPTSAPAPHHPCLPNARHPDFGL